MHRKHLPKVLLFLLLFVVSCQAVPDPKFTPSPKPTQTVKRDPTSQVTQTATWLPPTSTNSPENVPTATTTSIADDAISFDNIKAGQYLLVDASDEDDNVSLYVVSPGGEVVAKIPVTAESQWSTTIDGSHLMVLTPLSDQTQKASIFDFSTKTWDVVDANRPCPQVRINSSPDGQYVSFSCYDDDTGTMDIYMLDRSSQTVKKVTDCQENRLYCAVISWSFDGKWLSYSRTDNMTEKPDNGIYVFNTDCFKENENSCMKKQIGPINSYSYAGSTWSKTNELILTSDQNTIQFGHLNQNSFE